MKKKFTLSFSVNLDVDSLSPAQRRTIVRRILWIGIPAVLAGAAVAQIVNGGFH